MKVPKRIKNLLRQREETCQKYLRIENEIDTWLEKNNLFKIINCGDYAGYFNTGAGAFEEGSAEMSIEYLESLELEK